MTFNTEPFPFGAELKNYAGFPCYVAPDGKLYATPPAFGSNWYMHEDFAAQMVEETPEWREEKVTADVNSYKDFLCLKKGFIGFSVFHNDIYLTELFKVTKSQYEMLGKLYEVNGFPEEKFLREMERFAPPEARYL